MNNHIQPGNVVTLTAPGGGVLSGTGYQIGQMFVVATADAIAGARFEGVVVGVFTLPKVSAQVWTEGDLIYWDDGAGDCTNVSAVGHLLIGAAVTAAVNPSATGEVRLNGSARADE